MLFPNLKLYAIIAGIILLVIAGLSTALAIQVHVNKTQAADAAKVEQQLQSAKTDIKNLQLDAERTKKNQEELYATLNDIRTQAKKDQAKPILPKALIRDKTSDQLEKIINDQTKTTLHSFEVLTGNVSKPKK